MTPIHRAATRALIGMGVMAVVRWLSRLLVLVVVDLGELRVDDVILRSILGRVGLGLLLVHGLSQLHGSLCQRVGLGLDRLGVVALQRFLEVADGVLDRTSLALGDLRTVLGECLLGGMHQRVGVVLGIDCLAALLVRGSIGFRVLDHLVDVRFRQATGGLNANLLLLAGRLVLGRDVDNAIGVD